ncbi:MAG: division/cell wall cluster transcriptional repressor MraZ [Treponema sp.]|nr:division/cell wall cluster transcriptional repressor MraZ [Treponema sp.]
MNLLTGEYNNTLDEKGRILFPAKLRSAINQNVLMITKGSGRCLWLFTLDEWEQFQSKITGSASLLKEKSLMVVRRFIAPAQDVEFDKNGRLSIPQSLRDYAGLTKDCTILGMAKYVELWDSAAYEEYLQTSEEAFRDAAENFGDISF